MRPKFHIHTFSRLSQTYFCRFKKTEIPVFHARTYVKMGFSNDDKAVMKNDYIEKGWAMYRICKEHHMKKWYKRSV